MPLVSTGKKNNHTLFVGMLIRVILLESNCVSVNTTVSESFAGWLDDKLRLFEKREL